MKQKLHFTITALLFAITAWAQGPNESGTYYSAADGKKGAELKTALCGIITQNHTSNSYSSLWGYFETTDKRADGKVWDMYSSITNYTFGTDQDTGSGGGSENSKFNREHSFPNSWFGGQTSHIAYADLFHLYPTDKYVNNRRGNNPFGETNGNTYKSSGNFSKLGTCTFQGYTGTVFEPNDIYKGDFARTYFYMVTRYENEIPTWYTNYGTNAQKGEDTSKAVLATLDGNKYPGLAEWQLNMLMEWAKKDPVSSDKEVPRNTAVYGIQNNRNPFIDYPGLEEYIWGSYTDVAFSYDNYQTPTAIVGVQIYDNDSHIVRVYTIQGVMVKTADTFSDAIQHLPRGLYIIDGKKFLVK